MDNVKNPTSLKLRGARETIIISLGGSLVAPNEIDVGFLKSFKNTLQKYFKTKKFFIIVGGGKICRMYQKAILEFGADSDDREWIGINVTRLNAEVLKQLFKGYCSSETLIDPNKKVKSNKGIIIGAGWKPGGSTDRVSVLLAKTHGIKTVINLTNVDYVYDKNPNEFSDAKPVKDISWKDFAGIVGDKWSPGTSAPFDPIASKLARKLKLKVVLINGKKLEYLEDFLENKPFIGTVIQ